MLLVELLRIVSPDPVARETVRELTGRRKLVIATSNWICLGLILMIDLFDNYLSV